MHFLSIHVEGFGSLQDWRAQGLQRGIVVLYGPNEAGKSTLFRFLTTMLYGIYPADAARHPFAPWDGGVLGGSAELALTDGTRLRVHRRLLSQPRGVLEYLSPAGAAGGEASILRQEELRNRSVPFVELIPQKVFEDVYALTLQELQFPTQDAWNLIQERLLGQLGNNQFRSLRQVWQEVQQEADRLWRPVRRGHQRLRQLSDRIAQLRQERLAAAQEEREIRAGYQRLASMRDELARLRQQEAILAQRQRVLSQLLPVHRMLQQIRALETQAGDLSPWQHLPEDPAAELARLRTEIARRRQALRAVEEEIARYQQRVQAFTEDHRQLLQKEAEIGDALPGWQQLEQLRARARERARQIRRLEEDLAEQAARLFREPWSPAWEGPLTEVNLDALREELHRYREADRAYEEARRRTVAFQAQVAAEPEPPSLAWPVVVILSGIAAAVVGGSTVIDLFLWGGLLLILFGLLQFWSRRQERARLAKERARRRRQELEFQRAETEAALVRDQALQRLEKLLSPLPLQASRLETPDETLLVDLQQLQDDVEALQELREEAAGMEEELQGILGRWQNVLAEVAATAGDGAQGGGATDVEFQIRRWPELVAAARQRQQAAQTAAEMLARLTQERNQLQAAMTALEGEKNNLEAALATVTPAGTPPAPVPTGLLGERQSPDPAPPSPAPPALDGAEGGSESLEGRIALLLARRKAARDAAALREHLQRHHPDWEERAAEIARLQRNPEGWAVHEEALAATDRELEALRREIEQLQSEAARLEEALRYREEQGPSVAEIDGEIAVLQEERRELSRKRDRLALLARVLEEADRRFREEHQPDVLRRAGRYLEYITGGRYVRLLLDQQGNQWQLQLREGTHPFPRDLTTLSRGTLDQLYLALRLAIVDHLDADGEPLPLFLDEILINWDARRREHGLRLLREVSARRQVFLFTCHEWLAEELTRLLPAQRIDLPGPHQRGKKP